MQNRFHAVGAVLMVAACLPLAARADVVISSDATTNMTCSAGVCAPTATDAVLNVGDLENLLASGNIELTTTAPGVQANDIDITAAFSWTSANSLSLDAYHSITFTASVSDGGTGGASLVTNDGGSGGMLLFVSGGSLSFAGTQNALAINGTKYKLETTIKRLAYDIAAHPGHAFALASDIDANRHTFRAPPISVDFAGSFNGLGHTISNFAISDLSDNSVAFFATTSSPASIASVGLRNIHVTGESAQVVGGLIAQGNGTVTNSWVTGKVEGGGTVGALIGFLESGSVSHSWASAHAVVFDLDGGGAGGLVGLNSGTIDTSFAAGPTTIQSRYAGGLVGFSYGTITNSYAVGRVYGSGTFITGLGGLAGGTADGITVTSAYSAGHVSPGTTAGGFIGANGPITAQSCYWDKSVNKKLSGVGSGGETGIKGLTTLKLRSKLPKGFDPAIWAQDPTINNGFPYLIANPPQ